MNQNCKCGDESHLEGGKKTAQLRLFWVVHIKLITHLLATAKPWMKLSIQFAARLR